MTTLAPTSLAALEALETASGKPAPKANYRATMPFYGL